MTDPAPHPHGRKRGLLGGLRASFLTGLVVILPIGLTLYFIWVVTGWIDSWVLPFVPHAWKPETLIKYYFGDDTYFNVRGIGVLVFLVFTIFVGWIAKGILGRMFIDWTERTVNRLPVVRSIYTGLKQIAETVFAQGKPTFDRACLIEFPRPGMWSVGFVAGEARGEVAEIIGGSERLVTVYIPTTPNPTSGYVVFLPASQVRLLDMSIEDAAKLVISAGLVYPPDRAIPRTIPPPARAAE
ncbi:MAG: DUF502 domain-containing protein [Gemmobacter sp.]